MRKYQLTIDDYIGRWGYSKQYVRSVLAAYADKHVDVRISSLGGDLDHGLDIRQQFKEHGDVTVYLSGFVASAATVVAMGAKRVCMSRYAMFLVHKCSNFIDAWGNYNADQMQELIEQLEANKKENDKIDVIIAQMYSEKCKKKKVSEILDVLKEGRWLTAEEALSFGFIDEIIEDEAGKTNFTQTLANKFNALGLSTTGLELDTEQREEKSMLRQILDYIKALTSGQKGNSAEEAPGADASGQQPEPKPAQADEESSPQNKQPIMDTNYTDIMSLLGLEALEATEEGAVTMTAEQMRKVNTRLAELAAQVEQRDSEISKLNEKVETLKKLPGAETTGNLDDTGAAERTEEEMYNIAKNYLDL